MVTIRVPATTANIGPGFDCLGLALSMYNYIQMDLLPPGSNPKITVSGEGAEDIPRTPDNLVYRSAEALYHLAGESMPPLQLHLKNGIPVSRGLGSSAAAIVGGVFAANLLLNNRFPASELLTFASCLEGHPDNIAPAFLGGAVISCWVDSKVKTIAFNPGEELGLAVIIPENYLSTSDSRRVLPKVVSFQDAVFNVGRTAALVAAMMKGDWAEMPWAIEDRLHQPYRVPLIEGWQQARDAAFESGAFGFFLSGSGPTMIAFCHRRYADNIAAKIKAALNKEDINSRGLALTVAAGGATETII